MQTIPRTQSYQQAASTTNTGYTFYSLTSGNDSPFIPHVSSRIQDFESFPMVELPALTEHMLLILGEHLAMALTKILDQLNRYNQEAVFQIASIVEPYTAPQKYEEHMPAKSSREVVINLTRGGKPKPKAHLD
ncbi:MAG TPA: hypothetical protein VJ761_02325 [Ktedonobacteraceae bacterium]|nr:hypothetical protein [Ktedonobacteraceae bacterium]